MSSEIFYDRAFIKAGDKYIPLVNQGSSNCFECYCGREVPERYWNVLNFFCRSKVLFSEKEIQDLSERMEKISVESGGGIRKSRSRCFDLGECRKWILNGIKAAYTVEEYTHFGNEIQVVKCDAEPHDVRSVSTTVQLIETLKEFEGSKELNVIFSDSRSVRHPYKPKVDKTAACKKIYVLKNQLEHYFVKLNRKRIIVAGISSLYRVRAFLTEKAARNYLAKYADRLKDLNFEIACIDNPNYVEEAKDEVQ